MGDFVQDGSADLFPELGIGQPHFQMGLSVDHDPVREGAPVVGRALGERNTLVQAQHISLFRGGSFLDNHMEVVDLFDHPLRESVEGVVDSRFELEAIHTPD